MWIAFPGAGQICLRMPKGPSSTEIWWFSFIDRSSPLEAQAGQRNGAIHTFGPAGWLEQDDGENRGQSTIGTRGVISQRFPLHYAMNLGHGEIIEDETGPPHIDTMMNEHAQLWLYRSWSEWMAADSWADLKANHSPRPSGFV